MATLSVHAERRSQQRGIPKEVLSILMSNYDTVLNAGAGCVSISLSRKAKAALIDEGHSPVLVERALRIIAVMDGAGLIRTVLRDVNERGRRYRRQMPTHKKNSYGDLS